VVASVIKPRDLIRTQPYNQASPDVRFRRELKLRAVIKLGRGPGVPNKQDLLRAQEREASVVNLSVYAQGALSADQEGRGDAGTETVAGRDGGRECSATRQRPVRRDSRFPH
jgi:hypothetical protein